MADSIRVHGIIQPVTLRKLDNDRYQIISGERRYRASRLANLSTLPAYIRVAQDDAMLELALIENIQREDLDAIEIAISYQRLIDECNLTQEALSDRVGKKRATVANYLRLLKLPPDIQLSIRERKLSMGHAKALLTADHQEDQLEIFHKILSDDLSVCQVEAMVKALTFPEEKITAPVKKHTPVEKPKEFSNYAEKLRGYFRTKVELIHTSNGAGRILIPFGSESELLQIMNMVENLPKEE